MQQSTNSMTCVKIKILKEYDIIKHNNSGYTGIILSIKDNFAEILWLYPGMYNPEVCELKNLELIESDKNKIKNRI